MSLYCTGDLYRTHSGIQCRPIRAGCGALTIGAAENLHSAASLVNLLVFLNRGKYRNLLDRALQARLVYKEPDMLRVISFEYLNRQLVWQELSDLALFLLPLINAPRLHRLATGLFSKYIVPAGGLFGMGEGVGGAGGVDNRAAAGARCTACASHTPTLPYAVQPCGHVYCYYCVRARCEADRNFKCLACDEKVVAIRRCNRAVVD